MTKHLPNEIVNLSSFRSAAEGTNEESQFSEHGVSLRCLDLPAPRFTLLEALTLLSAQAQRKDITNQDLDTLAEHNQKLYDGKNKGIWTALKNFFKGFSSSYRRERMLNAAAYEELRAFISDRKEEKKLVTEPEILEVRLTDNPTPLKTEAPIISAAPKLSKKYEKLSEKLTVLKLQASKEAMPAKMKALYNYPLLSRDISKASSELKMLLKAKDNNQEASVIIKEQMTLLVTLKKQVDQASAQLGRRIESMSKTQK